MRLHSQMLSVGWVVVTVICASSAAFGQQALSVDRLTNGPRMRVAFEPAIQAVRPSVVRVLMDNKPVALGLIVSAEGLVISKASEIDPLHQITIQHGRDSWPVRVVGWSEPNDLALFQMSKSGWPVPAWSTGEDPGVGQFLITPGVEKLPLAVGVVSVARRTIEQGEVRGILGVQLVRESEEAVVENMFDGSAAIAAGIQIGDRILKVGSVTVGSRQELIREIARHLPGETVVLEVRRAQKTLILPATLTHPFGTFLSRIAQQNRLGGEISRRASGFPVAIQHDSVLKPEECGGPAVNIDGQIVGINIARSGRTESLMIPTSVIQEVLQSQRNGKLPPMPTLSPITPPPPHPAVSLGQ